jgi:hypothetical protein
VPTLEEQAYGRQRMKVEVRDLQAGDLLIPSGRTVEYVVPYGGARTPAGKSIVKLTDEGHERTWGRYTRVHVARAPKNQPS